MLAERVRKISPSATLAIDAKVRQLRKEGKKVIDFGAGQLDFNTPDNIKKAAIDAVNMNFSRYTPSAGIPELREAISQKFRRDNKISYEASEIIVSCGGKHSLYNIAMALLEKGDEVILPRPFWISYDDMIRMAGARTSLCNTDESFRLSAKDVEKSLTRRTKMIIINTPNNPTGSVMGESELRKIADIAVERNLHVVSDEVYEFFCYGGRKHLSIASFNEEIRNITITVNSLSKTYAMTGWRLGYCGADKKIVQAMENLQSHSSNASSIAQMAALEALNGPQDRVQEMVKELDSRRKVMHKRLNEISGIKSAEPEGAFYIFADISGSGLDSMEFASRLLNDEKVAVIPGRAFGSDRHVRLSYATSMGEIKEGLARMEKFVRNAGW